MCIPTHDHQQSKVVQFPDQSPATADCCVVCDELISSTRQINVPGTDVCDRCAGPEFPGAA